MIRVERVTRRYGAVTAVDDLSFQVEAGETFALIGPNGAGKTTTLKILLGLARPDHGRVALGVAGLPPTDPRARRDLGYVPQRVEFPSGRTVADVLTFYAALRGAGADAVPRVLARVGLETMAERHADTLSGGYTQRLSLAQALLGEPALLILDEPTASLDPEATWEFRSLLESLRREGTTIVLSSHLLSEVERIADRVLILVNGRAAALERLDDLRARQTHATRLRIECDRPEIAARALDAVGVVHERVADLGMEVPGESGEGLRALEALRVAGIAVRAFETQRPTLEELFLSVVRRGRAGTGSLS